LRTRFYDPANGRFTRRDGWEGDIFDPESLHKYVYVENDPVDMIDPSGRFGVFSISISLSIHSILIGIYGGYLLGGTTAVLARVPDLAGKIATRYAILITAFAMGDVGGDRYPTWFGTPTAARLNHVSTGYSLIYDALHGPITFHYTSDDCYAYVYPGGPVEIWLGPLFFRAPLIGYDSRAGVIVHEVSHEVHGTDDYVYGQRNAKWLATNRPDLAIDNADNYEYFAEGSF